jgi:hypothetical protein
MSTLAVSLSNAAHSPGPGKSVSASVEPQPLKGILLTEPNISLLSAETLLLTESNYCVTPALSNGELFVLRHILSGHLQIGGCTYQDSAQSVSLDDSGEPKCSEQCPG